MFRLLRNRRGQNTAEYAILIGIIVAAVLAMQTYVKRGIQGKFKDTSDTFIKNVTGDTNWSSISTATPTAKNQYEPENLSSQSTQQVVEDYQKSTMEKGGKVTRESTRTTKQAVGDYQQQDY